MESQTKQHYRANWRRLETHSRLQLSKVTRSTRGSAFWSLAFAFGAIDRTRTGLHLLHKQAAYLNASERHKNTEGAVHFCAAPSGNFRYRDAKSRYDARGIKSEIAHDDVTGG